MSPDVVLLDIGLPEIDGCELAERFRCIPRLKGIRLVAVTGYGQTQDRQRTRAAGFADHLVKSVDLLALNRVLAAGCPTTHAINARLAANRGVWIDTRRRAVRRKA